MSRASESQKAERLNRARDLLRDADQLSEVAEQLAQDCSISTRQAYRYLEQAQGLKRSVPLSEAKQAFTVKLPRSLVERVRTFAATKGLSIMGRNNNQEARFVENGTLLGSVVVAYPTDDPPLHTSWRSTSEFPTVSIRGC
jgi:hypothetical protein